MGSIIRSIILFGLAFAFQRLQEIFFKRSDWKQNIELEINQQGCASFRSSSVCLVLGPSSFRFAISSFVFPSRELEINQQVHGHGI